MGEMFFSASEFNQNLYSWDVGGVTNMQYMFEEASAFNKCLAWDIDTDTTNTDTMFSGSGTSYSEAIHCTPTDDGSRAEKRVRYVEYRRLGQILRPRSRIDAYGR